MRIPREIAFRLKQELANLLLWCFPPSLATIPRPPKLSPEAEQFRSTASPAEIVRLADEILSHRFPIFGGILETGAEIAGAATMCTKSKPAFPISAASPISISHA